MDKNCHFYKFRRIDKYTIESLVTPSLYFARPSELNDPFDCQINLDITLAAAAALSEGFPHLLIDTSRTQMYCQL